jgi:hypothetical protein
MENNDRNILINKILNLSSEKDFESIALDLFFYQAQNNNVYGKYLRLLGINYAEVSKITDIPFLPVTLFKTQKIITGNNTGHLVFRSSGTGDGTPSCHYIADHRLYESCFMQTFKMFYGEPSGYTVLALLPSYLERGDSSLVYMVSGLIGKSPGSESGFYLDDTDRLAEVLMQLEAENRKTMLIGVSFALLDLVERHRFSLKNTIIMETGGMKGRRKELTREELHSILKGRTGLASIHSEYGMTELMSQAYSEADGLFKTPPWMRVFIRDAYDPFSYLPPGRSGGINIIDLANIDSCAFIETADLGRSRQDSEFEVLGRFDNSDVRGCNLLAG